MQSNKTYIIAEAGVNHNGSVEVAHKLLQVAADCGADCVKFQTFKAELLCSRSTSVVEYQGKNTNFSSQQELLRSLELPKEAHYDLLKEAKKRNIEFLSTPFDIQSLDFLINELGLNRIKISSGDLLNSLLLVRAAQSQVNVILSSGMACLGDIEIALASLVWGYTQKNYPQSLAQMLEILQDRSMHALLQQKVTLLHCTSAYPAPFEDINLGAMKTLKQAFGLTTGYSDHTMGIEVSIAAVAMGAQVIEKHFTMDQQMDGPDHKASLSPIQLGDMITAIRNIEKAAGSSFKYRSAVENEIFHKVQKKILANKAIRKGDIISTEHISLKRNESGRIAYDIWDVLGRHSLVDYKEEDPLQ